MDTLVTAFAESGVAIVTRKLLVAALAAPRKGKEGEADLGAQIELSARSTGKTGLLREPRSMVENPEDEGKGKDIVGGREGEKSAVARIPHQIATLSQKMSAGRRTSQLVMLNIKYLNFFSRFVFSTCERSNSRRG